MRRRAHSVLVIERVPAELAATITVGVPVPTIGIGAGPSCDGQVLVINDVIGLGDQWPPFSRQYAHVGEIVTEAARCYVNQVEERTY